MDDIFELFDELDDVLRHHNLQIGTITGSYSKPICLKMTIEERDKETEDEGTRSI